MADAAARIDAEVAGVERRVVGRDRLPAGSLRVTTTDTLLTGLLSPVLVDFRRQYPEIALEIVVAPIPSSISRTRRRRRRASQPRHRPGTWSAAAPAPSAGRLRGCRRRIGGPPDPAEADWIGPDETLWYRQLEDWMRRRVTTGVAATALDSLAGMHAAVRAGAGAAVLPCYLG
ncbi:MAG: LysR substrate-binding domain-containing protein [Halofilum sp. (in: g-proteobacteria)]|nr:LysR substrate-binding domain-containing protein [Halofilum sp. (in: g-proteobacteria)]